MKIFSRVVAVILVLLMALPAFAQEVPLSELSRYLNGLRTAEAPFTQINADGSRAEGTVYIRRPGRMRFEYNAPVRNLVMAGGGQVAIFDAKSNSGPQQYPLSKTPLNLILAPTVDLGQARMVVGHGTQGSDTYVIAQDPKNPQYGQIRLVFSSNPIALKQWVITDEAGTQTTTQLGPLKLGENYPPSFFNIPLETAKRQR
ncbi:LolA family protein [Haematobacter genomosp. 1]|uniref:Cell envelope biogenesis protein LolA n=1 Tax=Haematobacter genomosp. 1 TaxID=366618 RepID=A0A212ACJ9_9RHOB|nr:outer membrane lipoprotein carrier protein LolA [Haematobacter genomosp. 1]OWJ78756.1 cell envelope biogenesis protein LolA [Haematobacter genomosp. 1]